MREVFVSSYLPQRKREMMGRGRREQTVCG